MTETPAAPSPAEEAQGLFTLAREHHRAGELDLAIDALQRLLDRFGAITNAYNLLAVILKQQNKLPAAIACLKRALAIEPNSFVLHSNLGNMLWLNLDYDAAMGAYRRGLAIDPNRPELLHNLGLLYYSLGNTEAAVDAFDRSIAVSQTSPLVPWDRALALLAGGDYAKGFAAYEARFGLEDPAMGFARTRATAQSLTMPAWHGEDLAGKTLYVHAEQGLGDTIQFSRFLPLVAARGARIVFDCQAELIRLMAGFPGVAELRQEGERPPAAHYHAPMLSLPHRLGVTLDTLPAHVPYLTPPATGPRLQRRRGTRLAVGIAWAGRPAHNNDRNRSAPFEGFLTLADLPGIVLYSLQKGARSQDVAAAGARALVRDLTTAINDFGDTARLIADLDLVITVDTAVAHLAGALGKPAYVLLPFTADWRWLVGRADSPWYPSLILFRQDSPRDWEGVMARVRDALAAALAVPKSS